LREEHHRVRTCGTLLTLAAALLSAAGARAAPAEPYIPEAMPPGFRVETSELDGPVFADPKGRTLYRWPYRTMRNGVTGDGKGESNCSDVASTESAGLMSPYPGGLLLPDLERRPSCVEMWPPALAAEKAKPVGKWTVVERRDGRRQWAYEGAALYTSVRDRRPGDILGGDSYRDEGDAPAVREPIQPQPDVPPGFAVTTTLRGRLLQTARGFSVYAFDRDTRSHSACDATCEKSFVPMSAPAAARAHGDWSIFARASGERQWTFRGKPLYRYAEDSRVRSLAGSDVPGWRNVYTQEPAPPPAEFTVQETSAGQVLADARGRTVYSYTCGDDAPDQLSCEHPADTQVYRLAMCGGGSAERCARNFPYVEAARDARSHSRLWTVMEIDPATGRPAIKGQPGALRVWAYRERPVYVFAGDERPGEVNADGLGEFQSDREGFRAFWWRDDFFER
jgi:predicted lipoprotein with Yx(FWY)xxD motif